MSIQIYNLIYYFCNFFNKFYLVDDDCADKDRTGGFGSTGKGE